MSKNEENVFCFKKVGDSLKCVPEFSPIKPDTSPNNFVRTNGDSNELTVQLECYKIFDDFFKSFDSDLFSMNLTNKNTDTLISLCKNLIKNVQILQEKLFDSQGKSAISSGSEYVNKKLFERDSIYKRKKLLETNEKYVCPIEKPVGLIWQSKTNPLNSIVDHKLIQTKYSFIPITGTIRSLFLCSAFEEMYIKYNLEQKHKCQEGVFEDFCCGSVWKKHKVFESPLSVQIQLAIDDFEPCDPLKSKAGNQKTCGIYFEIRNIPPEYRSKLDFRFLVALVRSIDLKENEADFDVVAKQIVNDLQKLATDGVVMNQHLNVKGGLINICYDNLGGNTLLGFARSFNAHYYCRICESPKSECQKETCEYPAKLRTVESYQSYLDILNEIGDDDLKATKGLRRYCVFNDLDHFHMYDNLSVDLMHDIYEGAIPFFLKIWFDSLTNSNLLTMTKIKTKIRDFNYGLLNQNYKPSTIKLDSSHFNQNAKQLYCLMLHLPFIFMEQKQFLNENLWLAMTHLLQIMQIIHSTRITTDNLKLLKDLIHKHLLFIKNEGLNLLPKHHFITHYINVIERMGPVIFMWMMRAESKHRVFTDIADNTHNFRNLPKTMSDKHQSRLVFKDLLKNNIVKSKRTFDVVKHEKYGAYKQQIDSLLCEGFSALKFLHVNSFHYRMGLMILLDRKPFEIVAIFHKDDMFKIIAHPYRNIGLDQTFNSIHILKDPLCDNCKILSIFELQNMKTYERVTCNQKEYIIADTLNVN